MATCGQTRGKKKKNQKDEPERSGKNSLIIGRRRPLRPRAWPRPQADWLLPWGVISRPTSPTGPAEG